MILKKLSVLLITFAFCEASDSLIYNQDAVANNIEIKRALGKTILNQQEMKANNDYILSEIKKMQKEINKLEKQINPQVANDILKPLSTSGKNSIVNSAITRFPYTNIREKPSTNSKVQRIVRKNTILEIGSCATNEEHEGWCKLSNTKSSYIRDYTLSFGQQK
ncbi:SH3 domain-containing protein [Sulfurimonas sp.]|uniref:SH3 domain-containing protein n=1 Tax=Sulfurimonas sp. TaxID=2022749 RepID=UPI0025D99895|nr:SH3 domain-containing protein [Sulfurimonas sp.]MBW6487551.1 SH3 domain-containing protein [Sulfurimonas sp.]